ncbi:V-type ATP synthase subunit F [Ructibacterium gallinarum]|uniref:V-type ATP synthase subunit F n=1 Tax=Ructibacterium gallinarum TaxID=2779355 RepID=A0A9D5M0Y2_9FIRM|nr:V-type ATP synthase subunit F [Ructibacterium gallinarum]MBE5040116.1 V-type ATP synthase subunit F [Ructibacterium gallinarum]
MANIAVIGERDSIYGFAALGLDTFFVQAEEEVRQCFHQLVGGGYGVIYITEAAASLISEEIEKIKMQAVPAVILIPGVWGNTGAGTANVKKSVEQAVGSDILFHN